MKVKALRPISVSGAVIKKGDVVEMSEDYVKAWGPDYVVPATEEETAENEVPTPQTAEEAEKVEVKKHKSPKKKK